MKREPCCLALLLLLCTAPLGAQDPLSWLNDARKTAGAPALAPDDLLCATATRWAQLCAAAGVLSHRGADGSTALDRYNASGGTEARVGEILGAGTSRAVVERSWLSSPEHRRVIMEPAWTHVGWGHASAGGSTVWVVQFTEKLVSDLLIMETGDTARISGRVVPPSAAGVVLVEGSTRLTPSSWDPVTRGFLFLLSPGRGYFRLEYLGPGDAPTLTNSFTLPRGTGSPGAQGRSAAPGASP